MKKLAQGLLARKKIVLIFLLAILLPALVVGTMSLGAFSKRREAVRRLLESNLWISGESALRTVETALREREGNALRPEHFARLIPEEKPDAQRVQPGPAGPASPPDIPGTPFLLDEEFLVVYPETGDEKPGFSTVEEISPESGFSRAFREAETYEFSQKNFVRAARAYREAMALAPSDRAKAMVLEALGRCLLSSGKMREAIDVYRKLADEYGAIRDRAGHFFGLTAGFQIYDIEKRRKQEEAGLRILLDLYRGLKSGTWAVSLPEYDFFSSEIESTLEAAFREGKHLDIKNSYEALNVRHSPYLQSLRFTEFLRKEVVPKIRERIGVSSFRVGAPRFQPDRMLANQAEGFCLVSYSPLPDFDGRDTHYCGFCWDLETLKREILPEVFGDISEETGLELENIEEGLSGSSGEEDKFATKDSLSLPYREFPLPWKLLVTQPELDELERSARRENFLYGTLLAFIVILMLLGAFLLGRDISRESETTRLKMEFVHNISHELKTPLTLIRLYGETLQRKEDLPAAEKKESYEIITKESERLSHLINNVLDFSRIDMGRKEFRFARGSLADTVRETLNSYRYHLEKKGFKITAEIDADIPEMNFDEEAMASVLVNLLSNAMKFSPARKEVAVRLFRRSEAAVLQVEDKGVGISKQDVHGIFKRFYRAQNSVVSETRGSGLGLTLVKHITEAHGGAVEVESEPGEGSVFSVVLPFSGPEKGEQE
jgi:signal transduction histidine kinase